MVLYGSFDECVNRLKQLDDLHQIRIKHLEDENKKLRDEHYKDSEIQKLQENLTKLKANYYRGFPITEKEMDAIHKWQKNHNEECHNSNEFGGCGGGQFEYVFLPTGLGTSGVVRCSCGAEFEFQEIG